MSTHSGVKAEKTLRGKVICPGITTGKACVLSSDLAAPHRKVPRRQIQDELQRYDRAVKLAVENLRRHVSDAHPETLLDSSKILAIHELMLEDRQIHESIRRRISQDRMNAEWSISEETQRLIAHLESSGDPYFQARTEDIWDMAHNIFRALSLPASEYAAEARRITAEHILVSKNLFISDVMKVKTAGARGLVTSSAALTSHAAILLRSCDIPSLGMVAEAESEIGDGDELILDGYKGLLVVRPTLETTAIYHLIRSRWSERPGEYPVPGARTRGGTRIRLLANIDNLRQIDLLQKNGLEGIGLFRTEFLLLNTRSFPGEEEQHTAYRKIVEAMAGRRVVMRTFDIGADKSLPYVERCLAQNPALGVRGIRRHLLGHPDELCAQLRALLRAAAGSSIDILFPMITTVDDVRQAMEHAARIRRDLTAEGLDFSSGARFGAMIEVPSAAISIEAILSEVDFASVGTNDLIQYFTASDRDNEAVQRYRDIHNEAVLFLLRYIIEKASAMDRAEDVTICGEIASEPETVPLLLQMGYRSLSISPVMAESIRAAIEAAEV